MTSHLDNTRSALSNWQLSSSIKYTLQSHLSILGTATGD